MKILRMYMGIQFKGDGIHGMKIELAHLGFKLLLYYEREKRGWSASYLICLLLILILADSGEIVSHNRPSLVTFELIMRNQGASDRASAEFNPSHTVVGINT